MKAITKYMIKQKLLGVAAIAVSIFALLYTKDATLAICVIPLGLFLIFTKHHVYDGYIELEEDEEEFY